MSVELIGPVTTHFLVVDGRRVPHLTATPRPGGIVTLTADERFDLDVPVAELDRVTEFIAFCIAVAAGYIGGLAIRKTDIFRLRVREDKVERPNPADVDCRGR